MKTLVQRSRGARLEIPSIRRKRRSVLPCRFLPFARRKGCNCSMARISLIFHGNWKNATQRQFIDFFAFPKQGVDDAGREHGGTGDGQIRDRSSPTTALALQERGWNRNALINTLDRRLPFSTRRDITRISSTLFIAKALDAITARTGMEIEGLARAKFRLVEAFVRVIANGPARGSDGVGTHTSAK